MECELVVVGAVVQVVQVVEAAAVVVDLQLVEPAAKPAVAAFAVVAELVVAYPVGDPQPYAAEGQHLA